jgi:MFS transporter, DHA2 family, multidrug resistance protein
LTSGYLLGTRGIGTFFAMMIVGRLSGKIDPRLLVFLGLALASSTLYQMVGWTPQVSAMTMTVNSIGQGVGLGFVFVPLNTIAFATLGADVRTDGAALWTLIRNLGSSVGISLVIASLTSSMSRYHSQLAEFINPFSIGMKMPDVVGKMSMSGQGLAAIDGMVTQQAAVIAYSNAFLAMTFVSLAAFPLLALIRGAKRAAPSPQDAAHAVMD